MNAKTTQSGKPERKSREVKAQEERERVVLAVARRCFGVETLTTRGSDALDFHSVAVWSIRGALAEAYEAGRAVGEAGKRRPKRKLED